MRTIPIYCLVLITAAILLLQGCSQPNTNCPVNIRERTVWTSRYGQNFVFNCDVHVYSSLRIAEGSVLLFAEGCGIIVHPTGSLFIEGTDRGTPSWWSDIFTFGNAGLGPSARGTVFLGPKEEDKFWKGIVILSDNPNNRIQNCTIRNAGGPRTDGYARGALVLGTQPDVANPLRGKASVSALYRTRFLDAKAPAIYLEGYSEIGNGSELAFLSCPMGMASVIPTNTDQLNFHYVNRGVLYEPKVEGAIDSLHPPYVEFVEVRTHQNLPLPAYKHSVTWPHQSVFNLHAGGFIFYRLTADWLPAEQHIIDSTKIVLTPKTTIHLNARTADLSIKNSELSYLKIYETDPVRTLVPDFTWHGFLISRGGLELQHCNLWDYDGYIARERPRGFIQVDAGAGLVLKENLFGLFRTPGFFKLVIHHPDARINDNFPFVNYWGTSSNSRLLSETSFGR